MKKEIKIKGSADPVNIKGTKTILNQMMNCICKIKTKNKNQKEIIAKDAYGTGFFCKIPLTENKIINCLMTNYHILDENYFEENKEIKILLNDGNDARIIDLKIKRLICHNEEYDTTLVELKEEDNIKEYLELDDNIFKDNEKIFYEEKSIYIIQYPNWKEACVSYGILNRINKYNIIHICSTDNGSSGSPILNLKNNKVIGIHKGAPNDSKNFNYGTLLKYPLNDFINKNKTKNAIIGEIYINKNNINNKIQIINSFENWKNKNDSKIEEDDYKYKNEKEIKENIEIKINDKKIEFTYYYKFKKEGNYSIEYSFKNNLTNTNYMFCGCDSITNLNLSNFNTKNVIDMRNMFSDCKFLKNLIISNIETQAVTNMRCLFDGCKSLIDLNLSNFNTQNVIDMSHMFYGCHSLKNLDLSNFNTKNVTNMNNMFYGCKSLKKDNIITKDNKILEHFHH